MLTPLPSENLLSAFLSFGKVEDKEQQLQFERVAEIFTWIAVILSLVYALSPFGPQETKLLSLYISLGIGAFILVWHRLIPRRYSGLIKNFLYLLLVIFGLFVLIHFNSGVAGYSVFFLYITLVRVGMSLPLLYTAVALIFTFILLFIESVLTTGSLVTNLSLAALHSWGLLVITFFGRYYASEAAVAKSKKDAILLDKEKAVGKIKDDFVFIISHQLKQPAVSIKGYVDNILTNSRSLLSSDGKEILENARFNSERLIKLLDDLLDISRIEKGTMNVQLTSVFLKPIIGEVLSTLFFDAKNKKISLLQKGDLDTAVQADVDRLKEVLTNLVSNAIKYTGEGGRVEVFVKNEGEFAQIAVSDNGFGISEEDQKHLFEKFYRVETEKTKTVKGSGLGLFITRNLIEKMGGDIRVDSQVGKGSTFTFKLPRYRW